jgi:hypothetical protein
MYNGHIQFLQTLDSLIITYFTYSKGLKSLTLLIIKTYNVHLNMPHNLLSINHQILFIFNIQHIYNYQGERTQV